MPISKQETRPVKRLENDFPYYNKNPELAKKVVTEQLCKELEKYIVFELTDDGQKALKVRGSIDILLNEVE